MSALPHETLRKILDVAEEADHATHATPLVLVDFLGKHTELPALWQELADADRARSVMRVAALVRQILLLNVVKWRDTIQKLERLFRTQNMHTWLIARRSGMPTAAEGAAYIKAPSANGIRITVLDVEGNRVKYHLYIACNASYLKSIVQLLGESKTYAENYRKLRFVGFTTVINE
jgi:coenzyme F420-reducing hydrogenase alpha subunit